MCAESLSAFVNGNVLASHTETTGYFLMLLGEGRPSQRATRRCLGEKSSSIAPLCGQLVIDLLCLTSDLIPSRQCLG